jgi:hypothetical protein
MIQKYETDLTAIWSGSESVLKSCVVLGPLGLLCTEQMIDLYVSFIIFIVVTG